MEKQHELCSTDGSARLVGVIWGEDRGVVNLDTAEVVMHCHGKSHHFYFFGPYFEIEAGHFRFYIPYVEIEDEDFRPLAEDEEPLCEVANWDYVHALLTLSSFKLADKLTEPTIGKRTRVC